MNQNSDKNYIQIAYHRKKSFNDTTATYCKLAICCTEDRIKFIIYNTGVDEIEVIEEYKITKKGEGDYIQALNAILEQQYLYFFRGKKIVLCIDSDQFTIAPKEALDSTDLTLANYLEPIYNLDLEYNTVKYAANELDEESIIFSVNKDLALWFNKINESRPSNIIHYGNALICATKNYVRKKGLNSEPTVTLFFTNHHLHIIIMYKDALQYYNKIKLITPESSLNFLLNTMKQLKIDRMVHKTFIFGCIGHLPGYEKLYSKYIKEIEIPNNKGGIFKNFYKKTRLESLHIDALGSIMFLAR